MIAVVKDSKRRFLLQNCSVLIGVADFPIIFCPRTVWPNNLQIDLNVCM